MNKIRLKRVEMHHFRSVRDSLSFDFPETGVVLLQGPSGAGKSTFILALSVVLDCCPFPMTELQSFLTPEPFWVKVTFHSDKAGTFSITRGAKNKLEREGMKPLTSVKAISEEMYKLFEVPADLTSDTVKDLTYRPQDEESDFLTWPNAVKQNFLATLLGMNRFEIAIKLANESVSKLQSQRNQTQIQVSGKRDFIRALHSQMSMLPAVDLERERALTERVKALEAQAAELAAGQQEAQKALSLFQQTAPRQVLMLLANAKAEHDRKLTAWEIEYKQANQGVSDLRVSMPSDEEQKLDRLYGQGQEKLKGLKLADEVARQQVEVEKSRLTASIMIAKNEAGKQERYRDAIRAVKERIATLAGKKCPTCQRDWSDAHFEAEELELARLEDSLKAAIASENEIPALRIQRDAKVWTANPEIAKIETVLAKMTEKMHGLHIAREAVASGAAEKARALVLEVGHKRVNFDNEYRDQEKQAQQQVDQQRHELESVVSTKQYAAALAASEVALTRTQLSGCASGNKQAIGGRASLEKQIQDYEQAAEELEKQLVVTDQQIGEEQDFATAVGRDGFMGSIFDEIVQEIAGETNTILGRVNNTSTVVLEFRSENVTQKGAVTKELKPYITIGGYDIGLKSGLSGGMLSAVKLANKLARRGVIGRRTGVNLGWICLDEPFNGMGRVDKETALEILNEIAVDDLVIVVDHGDSFKGQFAKTLKFQLTHGATTMEEVC